MLYFLQDSFIYYPTPEFDHPDYQSIYLDSAGASIKIWLINPGKTNALIYFGGNAEPVENNIPSFRLLMPDHTVYLVNYRDYGGSSGKPSETGLFADALNIFDHIKTKHTAISAMGRSLGSGITIYLASQRKIDQLILVTPYDSIEHVAQNSFPIFPMSFLLKDKYDSVSRTASITSPTLILIAENDRIIPPMHALHLAKSFRSTNVTTKMIRDTGHNTISFSQEYLQHLYNFMTKSF